MILAAGSMVHIAKPALAGASKPRARTERCRRSGSAERRSNAARTATSRGCKLIYQRVQGEQVVLRSSAAGNLLNRDEFIFARRARPCSCTREHRFRSLTPFAPGTGNSIPRTSFLRQVYARSRYDDRRVTPSPAKPRNLGEEEERIHGKENRRCHWTDRHRGISRGDYSIASRIGRVSRTTDKMLYTGGLPVPLIGSSIERVHDNGSLAQPVRTTFATSRSIASIGARIIVGT